MFCSKCGAQLPDGSAFCNRCGASTKSNAAEATAKKKRFIGTPTKGNKSYAAIATALMVFPATL